MATLTFRLMGALAAAIAVMVRYCSSKGCLQQSTIQTPMCDDSVLLVRPRQCTQLKWSPKSNECMEDLRLDQLAEPRHGPVGEAHELGVALRHLELLVVQPVQRRSLTTGTPRHTGIRKATEAGMGVPDDVRYKGRSMLGSLM